MEAVMHQQPRNKRYKTGLDDAEWLLIEPFLRQHGPGPRRQVDIREVVNALFYLDYTGCRFRSVSVDYL